jgi:hypothetical protein
MIKYFLLTISTLLALIVAIGVLLVFTEPSRAESKIFCAYNRVFVEFEDGKHKWGTLLLDEDGKPINCNTFKETDNTKGYV